MNTISPPKVRMRHAPSQRDQEIYLAWQTGRKQVELAKDYGVTQCRISQIICRVRTLRQTAGLAGTKPGPGSSPDGAESHPSAANSTEYSVPGTPDRLAADARQSEIKNPKSKIENPQPSPADLDDRLHREQLEFITRQALRAWRQENRTVTEKTGTRGDKPLDETTTRTAPPNLQCLRVALQATKQLTQARRASPGASTPTRSVSEGIPPLDDQEFRELVIDWLAAGRNQARSEDKVAFDPDNHLFARYLVAFFFGERDGRNSIALDILARDIDKCVVPKTDARWDNRLGWIKASSSTPAGNDDAATERQAADYADPPSTQYSVPGTPDEPPADAPQAKIQGPKSKIQNGPTTSTTPATDDSPQPPAAPQLPIRNPQSPIPNDAELARYISAGISEPVARRMRHLEKLQQLRELRRKGLPYMISFDSEDGPLHEVWAVNHE